MWYIHLLKFLDTSVIVAVSQMVNLDMFNIKPEKSDYLLFPGMKRSNHVFNNVS